MSNKCVVPTSNATLQSAESSLRCIVCILLFACLLGHAFAAPEVSLSGQALRTGGKIAAKLAFGATVGKVQSARQSARTPEQQRAEDRARYRLRAEFSSVPAQAASYDPVRGKVGVQEQRLNGSAAQLLGLPRYAGIYICGVVPRSRAYWAGIRRGDIVTQIDGKIAGMDFPPYDYDFVMARFCDVQRGKMLVTLFRQGHYFLVTIHL